VYISDSPGAVGDNGEGQVIGLRPHHCLRPPTNQVLGGGAKCRLQYSASVLIINANFVIGRTCV